MRVGEGDREPKLSWRSIQFSPLTAAQFSRGGCDGRQEIAKDQVV